MKRILFILAFLLTLGVSFNSCKAQDYIEWVGQSYEPIKNGYLYNWPAATNTPSITSSDYWVVPTMSLFNTLITYLGGNSVAGGKMKETGTVYWNSPNTGADNTSCFNGRGHGSREYDTGLFGALLASATYWSSEQSDADRANTINLSYNNADAATGTIERKKRGHGIRLAYTGSGTPTNYTGNDGKVYRIVQIGTQWWLADNLAETKYRDGSTIPVVTDNSAWAALTTGARCVYDNDESNK